jgi:hypothetical protein
LNTRICVAPVLSDQVLRGREGGRRERRGGAGSGGSRSPHAVRARFTGTHRGNGGEPVAIGIDVDRLYFFDLKTGNAIS